ncbi:isoleucyl-tRNA synthetase [Salinisphaera sp. PC39]|uniref:isoleucine--tRNA ligase n=1 Tax=Salinisphaera sp. PC39 TaxID=1304156 RepID=UPI003341CDD4
MTRSAPPRFPEHKGLDFPSLDAEVRVLWDEQRVFERCGELRRDAPVFTFYEGPPTANGRPGIHHVLGRTVKDAFCRYKTMRGYRVDRKAGWDTHGLPVEIEVEKELGLKSREDIEAYGIAEYNAACRESVLRYKSQWDELTRRIGYWVDLDHPYVTFANEYIESVWHLLRRLWDKGLLYKGYKIHWYSPGTGTVLSSHEVSLGYKEVDDPSVTVRFPVAGEADTYFLAWTTTPWTVISNAALAVGADIDYVRAGNGEETVILAAAAVPRVLDDSYTVEATIAGRDLVDTRYTPPFDHFRDAEGADNAWRVVAADFVSTEDGTGIVHIAPAFGADDNAVGQAEGLPLLNPVTRDGHFAEDVPDIGGLWFKDADKPLIRTLKDKGLLFARATVRHNYPHDWRKGTPLLNYPVESWFVRTAAHKDRLVELNETINWYPDYVGKGRFGDWLANNVDWALSRHRYWGTPLPIWVSDTDPSHVEVIGSIAELREKAGDAVPADAELDLHRPHVDDITWPAPDGGTMRRVPEIIDVWFDSGAMPFAQWHYPFENEDAFKANFPADFIAEGLDQTRGWFYTLHAIAALTEDSVAFRNVVVNGLLLDANGEKMSKSKGNTVDPFEALDTHGADVIRWYMLANSPPWENTKYSERGLRETRTKVFGTLENVYAFFATYANIDGFDPATPAPPASERPELDRWILSRLQTTAAEAVAALDDYNPTRAARAVERLIDELSNWYIRRSRARFWAGARADGAADDGADKRAAYHTTHTVLAALARLMAPISPFFADWLHRNLAAGDAPDSVHLADFPAPDETLVDAALERRMRLARAVVANVLALRNEAGINVRQPLSRILVVEEAGVARADVEAVAAIVLDEVNVDAIEYVAGTGDLVSRSAKPDFKRLGRRLGKLMQPVARAVAELGDAEIDEYLRDGVLTLNVADHPIELEEGDLIVSAEGIEGWLVGREDGVTVALDSTISDSLRQRGLAREAVNRIQRLRKRADFHVADRIALEYAADAAVADAIEAHRDWLAAETLAATVTMADEPAGEAREDFDIDGLKLRVGVKRVTD